MIPAISATEAPTAIAAIPPVMHAAPKTLATHNVPIIPDITPMTPIAVQVLDHHSAFLASLPIFTKSSFNLLFESFTLRRRDFVSFSIVSRDRSMLAIHSHNFFSFVALIAKFKFYLDFLTKVPMSTVNLLRLS